MTAFQCDLSGSRRLLLHSVKRSDRLVESGDVAQIALAQQRLVQLLQLLHPHRLLLGFRGFSGCIRCIGSIGSIGEGRFGRAAQSVDLLSDPRQRLLRLLVELRVAGNDGDVADEHYG